MPGGPWGRTCSRTASIVPCARAHPHQVLAVCCAFALHLIGGDGKIRTYSLYELIYSQPRLSNCAASPISWCSKQDSNLPSYLFLQTGDITSHRHMPLGLIRSYSHTVKQPVHQTCHINLVLRMGVEPILPT